MPYQKKYKGSDSKWEDITDNECLECLEKYYTNPLDVMDAMEQSPMVVFVQTPWAYFRHDNRMPTPTTQEYNTAGRDKSLTDYQQEYLQELIEDWINAYKRDNITRTADERSGMYDGICVMAEVVGVDPATLYSLLDGQL